MAHKQDGTTLAEIVSILTKQRIICEIILVVTFLKFLTLADTYTDFLI